ncbi:restriction endonuclease subunit S [Candidatus Poriferisodalis sp.]|uniref:restriction endonuclease subunit S n=1 Tax=Candidatus Poriferisodalis sp. TaxID=3101277 RepID=UPI003B011E6F
MDGAESLRVKRRSALHRINVLTNSVFVEMFGSPVSNTKGWPVDSLTALGSLERGVSKHRPRNDPVLLGGNWPLVQTGDVAGSNGYVDNFSATYSDEGLAQSRLWPSGTLCITIAANIAKTAILTFDACFPDSVVGFTARFESATEYVRGCLNFLQPILEMQASESAQKNINLKVLRGIEIPIPPISLMDAYAKRVGEINELMQVGRHQLGVLDTLFASLQQRVFRGEL